MTDPPTTPLELHLTIKAESILAVDALAQAAGLSKRSIKHAMTQGAVWLSRGRHTQRLRRASRRPKPEDVLHLYYDARILSQEPPAATLISDEGAYSVWFKPCGMFSQGSKWGDHCTIQRWSERHLEPQRSAFAVHRLDRAARGLILLAHSKGSAARLSELFRARKIEKRYRVIVQGRFPQKEPLTMEAELDGRSARSVATCLQVDPSGQRSLLEVRLETGRKHQIRRHLAGLGFPLVGDRLYGSGAKDGKDLELSAHALAFQCPEEGVPRRYQLEEALTLSLSLP